MSAAQNQYSIGLDKTPANYVPLTPLSFLARSAAVYPDHVSTVYEGRSFTWAETYERCRRFASWLAGRGIGNGDTVAAMLPNIPAMNVAEPPGRPVMAAASVREKPDCVRPQAMPVAQPMISRIAPDRHAVSTNIGTIRRQSKLR